MNRTAENENRTQHGALQVHLFNMNKYITEMTPHEKVVQAYGVNFSSWKLREHFLGES